MTKRLEHLLLVPGHAIYLGGEPCHDEAWALLPFQRGEPPAYVDHIHGAVEAAARDASALLVFSGGQTRPESGPRSEAFGYWLAAERLGWWGHTEVGGRATTEEFARDSLENLLFSVCRFREHQGHYPTFVTAIGWRFKAQRFALHAAALGLEDRFRYVGVNDPVDLERARRGEREALERFRREPLGRDATLQAKREQRNPERRTPPYALVEPTLGAFLRSGGLTAAPWS